MLFRSGFRLEHPGINHDEYIKGSTITTEVHWSLFVKESPYYSFFENVMERVHGKEKESFESEMSVEDFYLHLLAHMAKHFNEGGTGVRSVLDLWIYLKANREKIDREKLEDGLDKLGLRIFCQAMEELATSWFGPTNSVQETEVTRILGNFILTGNTYGNKEVNILARMYEQKGRRGSYLLKRCFPSVEKMSYEFPLLKKHAYLIPFCYLVRAFRILFFRRDNLTSELESVGKLDEQMILKMQKVKQLAGLGNGE